MVVLPPSSAGHGGGGPCEQVGDLGGQLGLSSGLLLNSDLCRVCQVHQGFPLGALLKVLTANALTDGRAHDLGLGGETCREKKKKGYDSRAPVKGWLLR